MSLPENTTVLIVGAGPAGLTAALSLAHHKCHDFVIVDAVVEGQNTSRSIAMHSATIEKYSAHPYALFVPQNVTELALVQKLQSLGVHVQRPHRVVGMKQNEQDSRITDVSFEDGQVIRARYIIGADGARSIIRTIAGIGFSDPEGPNSGDNLPSQMVSADVTFEPEPVGSLTLEGYLNIAVFSSNFFVLAPFGNRFNAKLTQDGKPITKSIFRIISSVPIKNGEPPHAPPKEYIQDLIDANGPACITSNPSLNPTPVKVDQLVWSTRFRTHSAIADCVFTRLGAAIFLVGDAAHIHSPAGGQGMNLGIRDAIFVAEAVTKHIKMSAENPDVDDTILQEIADMRHARALEIIGFTKTLLKLATLPLASIRDVILRILGRFYFMQSKAAWGLSGLGRR
ncbi:FAD/NAD(P)-binding domain-containing protein [Suillus decipiens]|nr:FAD/NAD(P)-binding domain-containing protein [Suillus decipiens]